MKNLTLTSLFFSLAILAVGCGTNGSTPATATQATTLQESNQSWTVELLISGGIAGLHRQLTIDNNGDWRASDRRQGHKSGNLSTVQLAQINELVAALETAPVPHNGRTFPGRCADCIETRLNATLNGKTYLATVQSGDEQSKPYAELNGYLAKLLQQTFSKN